LLLVVNAIVTQGSFVTRSQDMLSSTAGRVLEHTSEAVNEQIHQEMEKRVVRCAAAGREAIDRRLAELDQEWDIERALEANAATASLIGLTLGATVNKKWFVFPAAIAAFLLQHAVQGWCPPMPILRRLGFRTSSEIDHERYALKSLRGDFRHLTPAHGGDSEGVHRTLKAMDR
jgi:hypothetical protein